MDKLLNEAVRIRMIILALAVTVIFIEIALMLAG